MDIHFSAEGEKFRDEVRKFVRDKLPASLRDSVRAERMDISPDELRAGLRILV